MALPRRVAIVGGSFDPVHVAHVQLARAAWQQLGVDQVRCIPAGQPWQKAQGRQLAPAHHRLAMVRLAMAGEQHVMVDDIEICRQGPTYTIDTLMALQQAHPQVQQWYLVMGQDQYDRLPTWHRWQDVLSRVTLAVACRGSHPPLTPPALQHHPHQWRTLVIPPSDVSSTHIRAVLQLGHPASTCVPQYLDAAVAGYIDQHHLYAPSPDGEPH